MTLEQDDTVVHRLWTAMTRSTRPCRCYNKYLKHFVRERTAIRLSATQT